jgi:hypothetical protein
MPREALGFGRGFAALSSGWLTGAALTALAFGVLHPAVGALAFVLSLPVWLWGVVCLGIPVWTVLHHAGVRGPRIAAGAGGLTTLTGVSLLMSDLELVSELSPALLLSAGALTGVGCVVGWVVGWVAYSGYSNSD